VSQIVKLDYSTEQALTELLVHWPAVIEQDNGCQTTFLVYCSLIDCVVSCSQCAILSPTFKVREFVVQDAISCEISLSWNTLSQEEEG
jgi:hypothetical protein